MNWVVGTITGAFIETYDVSHLLSFKINKATLIRIDFNNGDMTFRRPLPTIMSSLDSLLSTVFISEVLSYSLGQEATFTNTLGVS